MRALTVAEVAQRWGRSVHFVRTLLREGLLVAVGDRIDAESVAQYERRLADPPPVRTRPLLRAVRMIRRRVVADRCLTDEQRAAFLDALARYEADT